MNHDLELVKQDFDNSPVPSPNDPKTQEALSRIAEAIADGRLSLSEFRDFLDENCEDGDFAKGCTAFVNYAVAYIQAKARRAY